MNETGEVTETAVVPSRAGSALIVPAASGAQIRAQQEAYQELVKDLLDAKEDYQTIGGKAFKKKSAWRKLSLAFGVDLAIKSVTHDRDATGRIVRTEVIARATAPNGRFADGIGSCSIREKCCPGQDVCTKWTEYPDTHKPTGHVHCKADCPGWVHFSHAEHDVPATAATRATNRAASDLFAAGEVSAEEMADGGTGGQAADAGRGDDRRSPDYRDAGRSAIQDATAKQLDTVLNIARRENPDSQTLDGEVAEARAWLAHPAEGEWPVTDELDKWLADRLGVAVTFSALTKAQASLIIGGASSKGNGGRSRSVPNEPPDNYTGASAHIGDEPF